MIQSNKAFTILEIIVVVIIVSVLASLALTRYYTIIEYSRRNEAFMAFSTIRASVERCAIMNLNNYAPCAIFNNLDVEDPGKSPNAHFTYYLDNAVSLYKIVATRNTRDGGNGVDIVQLYQTTSNIVMSGTGAFIGVNNN